MEYGSTANLFEQRRGRPAGDALRAGILLVSSTRSLHNGGVNVANLDCSVRFVVDDIDVGLLATSICINDGIATLESLD